MKRLVILGNGRAAERLADLAGWLGYQEVQVTGDLPADLRHDDHVVVAEEDTAAARELLRAVATAPVLPIYVGYAAPHTEGWKALVQLAAKGVEKARLDRICAPAGVDVGAETPEEVAIAVAAELVAIRHGRARPSDGLPVVPAAPEAHAKPVPAPRRVIGGFAKKGRPNDDNNGGGRN
jgi:xanthine/CO dehydrogenase XdhC/CoxF family maturation factor